jgi:hypothetical protein
LLGKARGLGDEPTQVGESGGGFGFHLASSDGGEEATEGGAEIVVGDVAAGEVVGDVPASFVASEGLGFFAGVEGTEVGMTIATGHTAAAAIGKGE